MLEQSLLDGPQHFLARFARSLSVTGVILAALFAAASLTPGLIPRAAVVQGVVTGLSCAIGYGIGNGLSGLWGYLELPHPSGRVGAILRSGVVIAAVALLLWCFWNVAAWQNSIRVVMDMPMVETARPWLVAGVALIVFLIGLGIGRLFALLFRWIQRLLNRYVPVRVSIIVSLVLVSVIFWSIGRGVLVRGALTFMDGTYQRLDALVQADIEPPIDPLKTGSPNSLIGWQGIGNQGRNFVAGWPAATDMIARPGFTAVEPLRVYVGLNSADTPEDRATLALAELKRINAFDRANLVIATPTGTGWVDPASFPPRELLLGGDVATVSVQYSYLPSWLSLMVDDEYGAETARAVFHEVYGYWRSLPADQRPRLYLHGLSLGSLNSDRSIDIFDVLGAPFQGALWVGPPFPSPTRHQITRTRNAGSPAYLPEFRDGSMFRFANQKQTAIEGKAPWGQTRVVYLQYPSDPIVFFETDMAWHKPDWMVKPRGFDVSDELEWYPVVSFVQTLFDMMLATGTPIGHGHVYATLDYFDGWRAVIGEDGWTPDQIAALRAVLAGRGL